ncbi:MAG: hypothetical protein HDT40_09445, partial [Lachnospiraceae bacterium]|nr:hypothetical protein [Lachnospiraceae bacterium]
MRRMRIKTIALLLVVAMTISMLRVSPTYAEDTDTLSFVDMIEQLAVNYEQSKNDAIIDSNSQGASAGLWWQVRADGLAWNKIHNSVQTHIRVITKGSVETERRMYYGQENKKELWGKYGSADIIIEKNNKKHIYEVKPYSYTETEKKNKAIEQLTAYVNCDPKNNVAGGAGLKSGKYRMHIPVLRGLSVEFVTYDVEYIVEDSTGLIFYKFKRYGIGEEVPEYAIEKVYVEQKEPARAKRYVIEDILGTNQKVPNLLQDIDWQKIFFLVATATTLYALYQAEAKNPAAGNSVAVTIVDECMNFLNKISRLTGKTSYTEDDIREINAAVDDFVTVMEVCLGVDFFDGAEKWFEADDSEKISDIIKSIRALSSKYYEACDAQPPIDPLVIDLGTSGIELHSMENGVYFDLDNNGFAEKTAWIGTEDGFLALDRDGNGKIENGGELFGDQIILFNGKKSTSGFEVLTELDDNNDGKIDSSDEIFPQLLVWTDANYNGISESGELKNLASLGIKSISLEHEKTSFTDEETGARIAETAEVEIEIGAIVVKTSISEFWFPVNVGDTTHGGIAAAGNIPEINRAIASDDTGELEELFFMFCESKDIAYKRYLARQIMYFISGAKDIDKGSRGGNINAKELKVVEQFMGRKFEGVGGENPNANAAVILKELYNDIEEHYYTMLNMYAGLGGYLKLTYEYEDDNGDNVLELSFINQFFDTKISEGEDIDYLVYDLGLYLKIYDESHGTNYYDEYQSHYSSISSHYADIVAMTKTSGSYVGDTDNEYCYGNDGSDIIFGEDGNDNISTGAGSDIIVGGKGNDILNGGTGNDTYIFNVGDGEDKIYETEDGQTKDEEDKIVFGYGITPDSIRLERANVKLVIYYGDGDKITIDEAYRYADGRNFVEYIEFSDGTVWGPDDIADHMGIMYGTEKNDRMDGMNAMVGYSGNEVF